MHAIPAGQPRDVRRTRSVRPVQPGLGQYVPDNRVELGSQPGRVYRHTDRRERALDGRRLEQLGQKRRDSGQTSLHPLTREVGAVTQPDQPLSRVVAVIGDLLDALRGYGSQHRIGR